jgi:hypothetical protein
MGGDIVTTRRSLAITALSSLSSAAPRSKRVERLKNGS